MAVKFKSISSRVSAVALAFAALALPAAAQAQWQEPGRQVGDEQASTAPAERRAGGRGEAGEAGEARWGRPVRQEPAAAPQAPVYTQGQPATVGNPGGWDRGRQDGWQGRDRSDRGGSEGREDRGRWGGWNRDGRGPAVVRSPEVSAPPAPAVTQGRTWDDRRRDSRNWTQRRDNDDRRDGDRWRRNDDRRDWNRDGDRWRGDRNTWGRDDNRWRNNGTRYGYSQDYRRWDNRWRDNRRYDWWSYRRANPSLYRHSYYAPYRNYNYRRLSIGFRLDSLFFGSRYWINDPWQYRLPDVYGPYRWVRYYDDALLVDIHTGEVVDVIYSFFW